MWTISAISYFCTLCDCTNSPINLSNESIRPAWAVPRIVVKIGLEWTFVEEKRKGWFIVLWACFSEILTQRISVFKKTGWKCCNLRELTMLPSKEEDHSTNNTFMHFNMWSKASLRHSLTLEILNSLYCFRWARREIFPWSNWIVWRKESMSEHSVEKFELLDEYFNKSSPDQNPQLDDENSQWARTY